MGCNGCPGADNKVSEVDKRGNPLFKKTKAELEDRPDEKFEPPKPLPQDLKDMSYEQYVQEKNTAREYGKKMSNDAVRNFSMDHKRIQIKELIDVVNHKDGGPLSPTQALQALYDFCSMSEYVPIFAEFKGLEERVKTLYKKLVEDNKIYVEWSP